MDLKLLNVDPFEEFRGLGMDENDRAGAVEHTRGSITDEDDRRLGTDEMGSGSGSAHSRGMRTDENAINIRAGLTWGLRIGKTTDCLGLMKVQKFRTTLGLALVRTVMGRYEPSCNSVPQGDGRIMDLRPSWKNNQ